MDATAITGHTCLNCCVRFADANMMRDHYKTDWHRYNLKRRVAELPPVTAEEFQKRVIQQREAVDAASLDASQYCNVCRKQFGSDKSYDNHLNSKKHKENEEKFEVEQEAAESLVEEEESLRKLKEARAATLEDDADDDDDDEDVEEVDSDEWEEEVENPIAQHKCMFCGEKSEDLVANLRHMSMKHSFFVPDPEFITDLEGLMLYLGEKIARDFICIWCNDRGRTFYSLDAARKHMMDKGHCKMLHEGLALAEYADYYDYSSSYPDNVIYQTHSFPTNNISNMFVILFPGRRHGHRRGSRSRYARWRRIPAGPTIRSRHRPSITAPLLQTTSQSIACLSR